MDILDKIKDWDKRHKAARADDDKGKAHKIEDDAMHAFVRHLWANKELPGSPIDQTCVTLLRRMNRRGDKLGRWYS